MFSHTVLALQFLPHAHTGPRAFSLQDRYLPLQTGSLRKMPGMAVCSGHLAGGVGESEGMAFWLPVGLSVGVSCSHRCRKAMEVEE